MVMNEIFGEENFVAQISVQSNPRGRQSEKFFATVHEYLIVYAKNINLCSIVGAALSEDQIKDFKFQDDKGKYRLLGLRQRGAASRRVDRPLMYFPIYVDPKTNKVSLEKNKEYHVEVFPKKSNDEDGRWMWSSKKVATNIDSIEARLISHRNEYDVFIRDYLEKEGNERSRKVNTIWVDKEVNNQNGTVELKTLFDDKKFFDFPKPTGTAKKILSAINVDDKDIILDFFAGSGTTAHAVLDLNQEDGGNRKFILVQLPEQCDENSEAYKAGYKTIADIAKERIRRVIQKIEKSPLTPLFQRGEQKNMAYKKGETISPTLAKGGEGGFSDNKTDLGFKVFKLLPSNFKIWRGSEIDSEEKLTEQLNAFTNPTRPGAEKQHMLYELMLKAGYELTSSVQYVIASGAKQSPKDKKIASGSTNPRNDSIGFYSINNNELIIALDAMSEKLVEQIIAAKPQKVITLDSLFTGNDQIKTNTVLQMRDAGVDFKTI
jgi:adenine-specific DNA-methyltransferase